MTGQATPRSWLLPLFATAAAYALVGALALQLAIPPSYASPLWPSAGIALACALRFGLPATAGVVLGSLAVHGIIALLRGAVDPLVLLLPSLGAGLQAFVGAWLVRRHCTQPLALDEPRDIVRFLLLAGPLACAVSPSVGTATLLGAGLIGGDAATLVWGTWWVGDALGVLIAAPVVLTLVGEPRADWAERRRTVALPLMVVTVLLALAIVQVARWDAQRTRVVFEHDAARGGDALAHGLDGALDMLQALHDLHALAPALTREQMRRAAEPWLRKPLQPQAIGWSERVPRVRVGEWEAAVGAEGIADFRVFDRADADPRARDDDAVVAIRYIEPLADNRAALGVNALSVPEARDAIFRALDTGMPQATGGFTLTQGSRPQAGVVVYRPVYDGVPATAAERRAALRGVVFVTLRLDDVVAGVRRELPPYLALCLQEVDGPQRGLLAGPPACARAAAPGVFVVRAPIAFAGRRWELSTRAAPEGVPGASRWNTWLFAVTGLAATALLGALLLTMSGRARRIARAVAERTAALQQQIDERNRTEAALRESEQRLRNILDHAPIGVLYTDLRGFTRDSNPRFREITGYDADELAAMEALDLTHVDDRAADTELASRLVRGEIPMYRRRKRYKRKDGGIVWVQTIVSLLRDTEGRPHRIVGVVEDISEHLKLQQAEDARAAAEASNRAKSDFLSRMSHELRTPLNAMLGFTQLLEMDREQPLSAAQRGWTAQVQQAGWHLLHMINDTLDLSRIESGTLRLEPRQLELAPLVASTLSMIEPQARKRGIAVDAPALDASLALRGDETRVKQILTNLLSNAVKYNADQGRITVSAKVVPGSMVEIEVADTGAGLSAQQLSELFQPFNRLGREGSGIEGTGIGLVISQRLAELMGGSLRARSEQGVGSSFVLAVPLAVDLDPTDLDRYDATQPDVPRYRRRSVLYVEDNETNAEVMRGMLLQRPQVELHIAGTARAAFEALRERHLPDLILLDMHLPDMDGLDLLRQLKLGAATAPIPVVAVSADATSERIGDALAGGAERYLTKPVNVGEMLAVIDDLLEKADTQW